MTPKEKAIDLFDKYFIVIDNSHPLEDILKTAKKCALIAIDEVLSIQYLLKKETWFYKEVKKEIEKL